MQRTLCRAVSVSNSKDSGGGCYVGRGGSVKRLALSVAALAVAAMILLSGSAVAANWYYTPNGHGTMGPDAYKTGTAWYTITDLSSHVGGGHVRTASYWFAPIISYGDARTTSWIFSVYPTFVPPASDYYTIYFEWYLTGYAALENAALPPYMAVKTLTSIVLVAYLHDSTKNVDNSCQTITVLSAENGLPGWVANYAYSNTYYAPTCKIALLAGHSYTGTTYVRVYNEAAGLGLTLGAIDAVDDLTVSQPAMIIYRDTGGGGGGGCVAAGTSILLPDNTTKSVERIKKGDTVMGYDVASGALVPAQVTGTSYTTVEQMISINGGLLQVTPTDQPLYVRNSTWQGWIRDPQDLVVGDQLFMPSTGGWVNVTLIETLQGHFKVYDLRVSAPSDFVANGLLVYDKV